MDEQTPGTGTQQQPAVNEDRIAVIAAETANKAFSERIKKFEKRFEPLEKLVTDFGAFTKTLDEKFAQLGTGGGKSDKKGDKTSSAEPSPELASMKRQLEELQSGIRERDEKLAAANKKQRDQRKRESLATELAKHGIDGVYAKHAMASLSESVDYEDDDSDALVFKESSGTLLPLADGVKSWAKTDDAKIFLRPTGARGTGATPPRQQTTGASSDQTGDVSGNDLGVALLNHFGGV